MRTIWNGSISFGLVNIPIGLALATQRSDIAFRTLHRECGTPIKNKRYCPLHERDVEADELVKGWEVAIGKFVLWGKENLCLIRPHGDSLALETLFFAEDVRSRSEIQEAVEATDVKKPELDLARQVIASLVGEFDPAEFENEYRRDLRAMLEAKLAGQEVARPEPVPETPVVDLMEALKQSVAEVQQRGAADGKAKAAPKRSRQRAAAGSRKS